MTFSTSLAGKGYTYPILGAMKKIIPSGMNLGELLYFTNPQIPEISPFGEDSPYKPPFRVTSRDVTINHPDEWNFIYFTNLSNKKEKHPSEQFFKPGWRLGFLVGDDSSYPFR